MVLLVAWSRRLEGLVLFGMVIDFVLLLETLLLLVRGRRENADCREVP
jgi:hypothetical protein